jgi:uncharacterized protein with HEPN domain
MPPRRVPSAQQLLRDMVVWGERLAGHLHGMDREAFLADPRSQDAACRCLEVIGEAAGRLLQSAPELERADPRLALSRAYGARNRIAHGYAAVDYALVWTTCREAVPPMVAAARDALRRLP